MPMYVYLSNHLLFQDSRYQTICTYITQTFCNILIIPKLIGKPFVKSDESKMLEGSFTTSDTFSSFFSSISDMPSSSCLVKTDFKGLTRPHKNNF